MRHNQCDETANQCGTSGSRVPTGSNLRRNWKTGSWRNVLATATIADSKRCGTTPLWNACKLQTSSRAKTRVSACYFSITCFEPNSHNITILPIGGKHQFQVVLCKGLCHELRTRIHHCMDSSSFPWVGCQRQPKHYTPKSAYTKL